MTSISSLSTIFIKATVKATISGVLVDPTADTVTLAFLTSGTIPTVADFTVAGSWETATADDRTTYYARGLATQLAVGRYDVWYRIAHSAETVVELAGSITVT